MDVHSSLCTNEKPNESHYRNRYHITRLFEELQFFRKDEVLCDIKLETDDGTVIIGHKVVLVSASPYFHAMFTIKLVESNKNHVNMKEINATALKLLVDYIYTGEIIITEENVQVLLPAANLLQLNYVKVACADFLQKRLNSSNCLNIKAFSDLHDCMELLSSCEVHIKTHFFEVIEGDEFLSLSFDDMFMLISRNDINVPSEEKIFECIINWVKHEVGSRYDYLPKLMEYVRLPLTSEKFILERVVEEPLIKNSPKCKDYVIEALNFLKLKTRRLISISKNARCMPRVFEDKVVLLLSLDLPMEHALLYYDPNNNILKNAPPMSKRFMHDVYPCALVLLKEHFLFAVGNIFTSKSVLMLDLSLQSPCWIPIVNMLVNRTNIGVGVIDDKIYAVGGEYYSNECSDDSFSKDGQECLNSVEVLDVNIQEWRMVSSMSTKRCDLGIGVLNNRLYAVGGRYSQNYVSALKTVECYNPSLNKWNPVAAMSISRYELGVGILDGVLYAVGGTNGSVVHKSVEAYRPSTGIWSFIADMHCCRTNPVVYAFNGLLYVMGGRDRSERETIEMYNPLNNTWSMKVLKKVDQIIGGIVIRKPAKFI